METVQSFPVHPLAQGDVAAVHVPALQIWAAVGVVPVHI
jgi:hypothetical protein